MSTQSLFQSLKTQTIAQSGDNVQPIKPHTASASRWTLFQSIAAKAWEQSPALSADEKLKRQMAVQSQKTLFDSSPHIRVPQISDQLAQGLRNIKLRAQSQIQAQTYDQKQMVAPAHPAAVQVATQAAKALLPDDSLNIALVNENPIQANDHDSLTVFRSRLSVLFAPNNETPASCPETSDLLANIFDRIQAPKIVSSSEKSKQSLRSTLSGLSRNQRGPL